MPKVYVNTCLCTCNTYVMIWCSHVYFDILKNQDGVKNF